jgi:hypothetical protein
MMNKILFRRLRFPRYAIASALVMMFFISTASAQSRRSSGGGVLGKSLVEIKVSEITLEAIDFRQQTARLSVGLDVRNRLVPVSLKDFEYSLSLFDQSTIEGRYDGTMKVGGRDGSRVNLPVTVNLRSIPGVVWNAFSNRGNVRYRLDTGFTLPLYIMERRFNQSFSGEVPLRSLVDAATIVRAGRGAGAINWPIFP